MANFTRTWDALPGGTLVASDSIERSYWGCFSELRGPITEINWTDDGTTTGTSLFDLNIMPWVEVQITAAGDLRDFTQNYYGGSMYQQQESVNSYSWWTARDPTTGLYWFTTVSRLGDPDAAASTDESRGATVYLHAVGDGG
jgi:hypothetical protein